MGFRVITTKFGNVQIGPNVRILRVGHSVTVVEAALNTLVPCVPALDLKQSGALG